MAALSLSAGRLGTRNILSSFQDKYAVSSHNILSRHKISQAMSNHKVFVYGTLKKGEPNHHLFSDDISQGYWKFIGKGTTVEKYPLIIGTKYNIPFLLFSPRVGHNVQGEIYEVDDQMLATLDKLEEHPDFYERTVEPIRRDDEVVVDCSVYFLKKFRPELLKGTLYSNYSSRGDHGLVYIDRYLRDPTQPAKQTVYFDPASA